MGERILGCMGQLQMTLLACRCSGVNGVLTRHGCSVIQFPNGIKSNEKVGSMVEKIQIGRGIEGGGGQLKAESTVSFSELVKSSAAGMASSGEARRGVGIKKQLDHWRLRTWSRMLQGRTGTGCPSYGEEVGRMPTLLEEVTPHSREPLRNASAALAAIFLISRSGLGMAGAKQRQKDPCLRRMRARCTHHGGRGGFLPPLNPPPN